ncbi:hypothetical protein INT43_001196 [Umbelopsis isabellina]|uniref:Glucosidase 2 subunit beta n=1 Tax=Mortierella isabellina TaxID=91625 RepID=A0A8H7PLA7_MORIS|nr:hypothetical protein INT43_001196 [Umbelopsis isabellina]
MLTKGPLSCILAAVLLATPALSQNVRGVAPENVEQALYKVSGDTWTCLDKSKTIPASAINDDYCDCPDGSDEPGTSACPNGVFYCENKGHIPSYIKSYRVNDGVCDAECCDGSDESSGLIKCDNICKEVGIQYRKQKAELDAIVAAGATTKREWIAYGQTKEKENQIRKAQLEEEIAVLRKELEVLQKSEDAARSQEKEARNTYATLHGSSGSSKCPPCKTNCDAAQLKIGSLKNHIRNLQDEVDELLNLLHDMKRDHNQNYHDMAVKSAISGYDEFLVEYDNVKSERQEDVEDTQYEENLESVTEDITDGFSNEESEEDQDPKVKEAKQGKSNMISRVASLLVTKLEHILPAKVMQALPSYLSMDDAERLQQVVTDASNAVQNKHNDIDNKESELRTVNEQLDKDYGKDKEWMKLDQQCFEKDEGEYVYSICIFGHAHQKSNRDGANTSLGNFESFSGSSDANSPEYHSKQLYNHGAKCWNGPERSVKAVFECGSTTEILEVTEPEKCEYQFKMRSPAACSHIATKEEKESEARIVHQEL